MEVTAEDCPGQACEIVSAEGREDYRADESKLYAPNRFAIAFPQTAGEIAGLFRHCVHEGKTCVLSGGRTGVAGGAVPLGADLLISCERMREVLGFEHDDQGWYIRCQPGVTLAELATMLRERNLPLEHLGGGTGQAVLAAQAYNRGEGPELWLPVNPTETGAQLGGLVATNASGSRTYRYGPLRKWVRALTVVLPDGGVLRLARDGGARFSGNRLTLCFPDGERRELILPTLALPETKRACGYECRPGMDLIDLFIGSEGTLGAFAQIELRLAPRPPEAAGVLVLAENEDAAFLLVEQARQKLTCDAIEYFDRAALRLIAETFPGRFPLPTFDANAVYLEFRGDEADISAGLRALEALLPACGLDARQTWAEDRPAGCERQRTFRHAIPEAVNQIIAARKRDCPALHKVGTDMAAPNSSFLLFFKTQRADLASNELQSVVFGHIGDGHVHINILPRSEQDLLRAKELYLQWAEQVVTVGGCVAAEHGIGRLKRGMLEKQYPKNAIEIMRILRYSLDTHKILGPGVLFDPA